MFLYSQEEFKINFKDILKNKKKNMELMNYDKLLQHDTTRNKLYEIL